METNKDLAAKIRQLERKYDQRFKLVFDELQKLIKQEKTAQQENLPKIADADKIQEEFEKYWEEQKIMALAKLCDDESLDKEQFKALIDAYIFSGQTPLRDDVLKCLGNRPSILQAREIGDRIINKMKEFVEVFEQGMVA